MKEFEAKVTWSKNELTAKDKIKMKDTTNAVSLDEATQEQNVVIEIANIVELDVHNEHSDNKDYKKTVVLAKDGTKYVTGSESFRRALHDIDDEMTEAGETDYTVEVFRLDSKNYKGKQFITCSVV